MKFVKSKWLAYTFLVGLIPILTRLLVWLITKNGIVAPLVATDFVAFGLVLHISVINELEHLPAKDKNWKSVQNGTSLIFISLYCALFAISIISEKIIDLVDAELMLNSAIFFAIISTLLSFSVFYRISKLHQK